MSGPPISVEQFKEVRQRARTDLFVLCRMLGYNDVSPKVHGKLVDSLQKFKGGTEDIVQLGPGKFQHNPKSYKPCVDMWDLEGHRKTLLLIPRGHLKTTVATIAHTIQWVINYPNIRLLLSSGTGDQVKKFLEEILGHFRFNEQFRYWFHDFCPQGKNVKDFGNQEKFTVPVRSIHRKEPTVSIVSVGSVVAGGHFDVIKNDDIVDKENVRTPEQIANVKSHYGFLWPLVETSTKAPFKGWMDVIGTRYDFSDLYGTIIDGEKEKPQGWHILEQSAIVEGDLSNLETCKTLWPDRVPPVALKEIADDPLQGPSVLASQYLMNPIPSNSGLVDSESEIVWIPMDAMKKIYAYLNLHVTVDLAGMEPSTNKLADNDYTVINLHGFGHDGSLVIVSILRGRYTPFEVIDMLFNLVSIHPRIMDIKVEKEAHARVLLPFLKREMAKRQRWLPIAEIRRDNRTSKQQRIKGLQPWFRNGTIKFADSQPHKLAIINEIMRFPKYAHDDILDTIADAMQNRDGGVTSDVLPMPKTEFPRGMEDMIANSKDGDTLHWKPALLAAAKVWGETQVEEKFEVDAITGW